jgi:hypothetical protein
VIDSTIAGAAIGLAGAIIGGVIGLGGQILVSKLAGKREEQARLRREKRSRAMIQALLVPLGVILSSELGPKAGTWRPGMFDPPLQALQRMLADPNVLQDLEQEQILMTINLVGLLDYADRSIGAFAKHRDERLARASTEEERKKAREEFKDSVKELVGASGADINMLLKTLQ